MAIVYLDSSVVLQAVLNTPDRLRILGWLNDPLERFVSSRILHTEVIRVLRREGFPPQIADPVLRLISLMAVTPAVHSRAEGIVPHIKTLDAIHLASALEFFDRAQLAKIPFMLASHDSNMLAVSMQLKVPTWDPIKSGIPASIGIKS